jgi:hypothetical protein
VRAAILIFIETSPENFRKFRRRISDESIL